MVEKIAYSNTWVFSNLSRNISDQVWEIGQEYRQRFQAKDKPRHINSHPAQLLKLFYFLYLTGARRMEPFITPPKIDIINSVDGVYVQIEKVNEKHGKGPDGNPAIMDMALPVFNEAEQKMWNYITDGGSITRAEDIFQFGGWGSTNPKNISYLIRNNFRTDMKDPKDKLHRDHGITPHVLRHMRAYNVIVNFGVEPPLAITWFGWTNERMLYHYAALRKHLHVTNQLQMLKRSKLLTNLTIDLGKAIPY